MAKIAVEKIITRDDLKTIDEEKYQELTKEASLHATYLNNYYPKSILVQLLAKRSREIAFMSEKYEDEDDTYKELLAANITYSDDEKIIRHLLSKGIGYHELRGYSNLISRIKKAYFSIQKYDFNIELSNEINLSTRKISSICNFFIKYYGHFDCNLILTKINDLVVFKKNLYLSIEKEFIKTKIIIPKNC